MLEESFSVAAYLADLALKTTLNGLVHRLTSPAADLSGCPPCPTLHCPAPNLTQVIELCRSVTAEVVPWWVWVAICVALSAISFLVGVTAAFCCVRAAAPPPASPRRRVALPSGARGLVEEF